MNDHLDFVHFRLPQTETGEISWKDAYKAMEIRCPLCYADPGCFCSQLQTYPPVYFHQSRIDDSKPKEELK